MKPLTEVIEDAERCLLPFPGDCLNCPHFDSTDDDLGYDCQKKILKDAVGYLREWRDFQLGIVKVGEEMEDAIEKEFPDNPPLNWEQLKQMEGKPVCVEELGRKYATPHWAIHHGIMDGYDGDENLYLQPFEVLTKYTLGKTWQAYRKERK